MGFVIATSNVMVGHGMVQLRVVYKVDATGGRSNLVDILPIGLFFKDVSVGVF